MFGTAQRGVNAYAKIELETGVLAASPHKLITMLFDGAKVAIDKAILHTQNKEIAAKGRAISHAISILNDGLRASLNKDVGGDIAILPFNAKVMSRSIIYYFKLPSIRLLH